MDLHLPYEVQQTADGTATLYVKNLDEHYHSVKGALAEAQHVYRDCAFMHHPPVSPVLRVLEFGFGTGLNACVTAMAADKSRCVHYFSLEKYPLDEAVLSDLHYEELLDRDLFSAIHQAPWNQDCMVSPYFTVRKIQADILTCLLPERVDVVYFDAFAPEKQPELWSRNVFERIFAVMNPDGILTTYCAKGEIRRMLASIGFVVERLAGPVGGKREILRAVKLAV